MSWRTVVISNRCKLDLKMGYMVIRAEETKRIFLDEIAVLLIENPAVSLTGCLLEALTEKKIRVIFCGSERTPIAELNPLHGSHDTTRKLRQQLAWAEETKGAVWTYIIADKIEKQAELLADWGKFNEAKLWNLTSCKSSLTTAQTAKDTPPKSISMLSSASNSAEGTKIR